MVTREQAWKKLVARYGKRAWFRVTGVSSPERREAAQERLRVLIAEKRRLEAERDARLAELKRDPEYQSLLRAWDALKPALNQAQGEAHHYKFTAGYISEMGFAHNEAEGDTWEEVFAKIDKGRS